MAPQERVAMLDRECDNDPALRREVEILLARHVDPTTFLANPAPGVEINPGAESTVIDRDAQLVGTRIGHDHL